MADRPEPMDEDDLVSILRKEEAASEVYQTSTLATLRTDALDYYDRKPYGDEQEGSSQVVTSEFADTIESIMPGLMEVFTGGDQVVQFTPSAPGQEKMAEEATDYVTHCFMVENKGFTLLHSLIKDALMFRLGGMSIDLEERDEVRTVQANSLTQDAVDLMVSEAAASGAEIEAVLTADAPAGPLAEGEIAPQTLSGTITIKQKRQKVAAASIAPEDIRFTPVARDQDEASFLGFIRRTTSSELIKLGLNQDEVDELRSDKLLTLEEAQRNDNASNEDSVRDQIGDSERPLFLVVAYVRADANGDGISEMLRVVYAHSGGLAGKLIPNEDGKKWTVWEDGIAPIVLASPILMPHALVGRSLFDQTQDIQLISSVLTRGMLDNLYMSIRPRIAVSDSAILDSVLDWVPGAPIRFKAGAKPGDGHIDWQKVPSIMGDALQGLEYFKTVLENRTGTSRHNQGLDAESLNKTKGGMQMLMSAAQQRQKLIARVLAETAIGRIYRLVYKALKRAAKGPVKYWKGNAFKTVDPSKWPDDMDMTVNVGLGTGNTQQELEHLMFVVTILEKLIALQGGGYDGPFVTAENIATVAQKIAEKLGFKTPGMFFQAPEAVMKFLQAQAGQPKPPPPEVQAEQAKTEGAIKVQQAQLEGDLQQLSAERQANAEKAQYDAQQKAMELAAKRQLEEEQAQLRREEMALKREEMDLKRMEMMHKREEMAAQHAAAERDQAHERTMAEFNARTAANSQGDGKSA